MPEPMKVISYGGGVQSTAMIVLATQGLIPGVTDALFSNVGDDSEYPATLTFVQDIMTPWAAERGIRVHELKRTLRNGEVETLWQRMMKEESKSIMIPMRGSRTGAPGNRSCTIDHKIQVVGKWLKKNGASKTNKATVCIGISTDEIQRANNKRAMPYELPIFPLIDLNLDRTACQQIIRDAGLPVPPKSSCFFCPFHRPLVWSEMRRDEPELFQKAVLLETTINDRRAARDKEPMFLTRFGLPLEDSCAEAQQTLGSDGEFNDGQCDEGYCWT